MIYYSIFSIQKCRFHDLKVKSFREKERKKKGKKKVASKVTASFMFANKSNQCFDVKILQNRVFGGKVWHLLYSPLQLQIAQAFQSQVQSPHEELAKQISR